MLEMDPPAPVAPEIATDEYRDPESFRIEAQDHIFAFHPHGADRMRALIDLIKSAESTLAIYYYMFQDDQSGTAVRDALVDAVMRGVDVHLIVDDFGTDAPKSFFEPIIESGGRFETFSPRWSVRYLIRNHQKFIIADNARVMIGGTNISDHYFKPPEDNGWCDLAVVIEGPVVERFSEWFELVKGWVAADEAGLRRIREMVQEWQEGDGPVRLLVSAPLVRRSHWAWRLKRDLSDADRLDVVTAYFSPPRAIRWLMMRIARRGKARMIAAGKSDFGATIDTARLLYKRLLRSGVSIFEFQPCKLHMKLIVVDDVSYFGSANFDKRSIRVNVELMVRVEDDALAARLREMMDHMQRASIAVTPEWYDQQAGFFTRLRWRLTYLLTLADYRVARGLNV